jgi:hypothetical protein
LERFKKAAGIIYEFAPKLKGIQKKAGGGSYAPVYTVEYSHITQASQRGNKAVTPLKLVLQMNFSVLQYIKCVL